MHQAQEPNPAAVPASGRGVDLFATLLRLAASAVAVVAAFAVLRGLWATLRTSPTTLEEIVTLDPFSFQVVLLVGLALLIFIGSLLVASQRTRESAARRVLASCFLVTGLFLLLVLFRIFGSLLAGGPSI